MFEPPASTEDFRERARRRLPKPIFDYIDGGSYSETTLRSNEADFRKLNLRQKVLVDVADRSIETDLLGTPSSMPIAIAPTGLTGILVPGGQGEIEVARAAKKAKVPFTLGVLSTASIEEVHAATQHPFWFQTKPYRDHGFLKELFARLLAVQCPVLFITVDGQVPSTHYRGVRNRFGHPRIIRFDNFLDYATRFGWSWQSFVRGTRPRLGNLQGVVGQGGGFWDAMGWTVTQIDPAYVWQDLGWIRENWPGKLVIKGVLDPGDAEQAIAIGADAISVSNHGGNQLDTAPSTIAALPGIVAAVRGRIAVLLDGGVRSGSDVIKALALGAKGCLIGRAQLYALAAMGEQGVSAILEIFRTEIDATMALVGVSSVADLSPDVIWRDRSDGK